MKRIYSCLMITLALTLSLAGVRAQTNYYITSAAGGSWQANVGQNTCSNCVFYIGRSANGLTNTNNITFTITFPTHNLTCNNCSFYLTNSNNTLNIAQNITFTGTTNFNVAPTAANQKANITINSGVTVTWPTAVGMNVSTTTFGTFTGSSLNLSLNTPGTATNPTNPMPANITMARGGSIALTSNAAFATSSSNGLTFTGGPISTYNNANLTLNNVSMTNTTLVNLNGSSNLYLDGDLDLTNSDIVVGGSGPASLYLEGNNLFLHDANSSVRLAAATNFVYDVSATNSDDGDIYYSSSASNDQNDLSSIYAGAPSTSSSNFRYNPNETATNPQLPYVRSGSGSNANYYIKGPANTTINTANPTTSNTKFLTSTVLPVVLVGFSADLQDNNTVYLSWNTQQEINSSHFSVERSPDGIGWSPIGTVQAKGNSGIVSYYSFTDTDPLSGIGYYRLRMVDLDNRYGYTEVKVVRSEVLTGIRVFPNPAREYLNISLGKTETATIRLIDLSGRTLVEKKVSNAANTVVSLPVQSYPQGVYVLQIAGPDGLRHSSKLLITR